MCNKNQGFYQGDDEILFNVCEDMRVALEDQNDLRPETLRQLLDTVAEIEQRYFSEQHDPASVGEGVAVDYQYRRLDAWKGWTDWARCGVEHYERCQNYPSEYEVRTLYTAPPASAVDRDHIPVAAINSILTEVMDIAAANGADSRSMPDNYVEVAAWLCGLPPAPPASALDEFKARLIDWALCDAPAEFGRLLLEAIERGEFDAHSTGQQDSTK